MKFLALCVLPLVILPTLCESAKILYVMPFSARSHYIGLRDLALELSRRGHEIHAITPYNEPNPPSTYHEILVTNKSIWNELFTERPNVFDMADLSFTEFQDLLYKAGLILTKNIYSTKSVQDFLAADHKFDLVISEVFFNEGFHILAHKYQAPLILVTTFGNSLKANYFSRNPLELTVNYHEYGYSDDQYSFSGRLKNLFICTYDLLMLKFYYLPQQEQIAISFFKDLKEPVPSIEELWANTALVLMNSHFSVDVSAPYLPNFIEVAGMHIKDTNNSLPQDLQKILDTATNGVVYMSFGSNVHSSELGIDKLNAFLKVFGELKQTVLMKWEDAEQPNVPKNVIMRKWFPQKDVLAHRNIKLFIGHGGLLGLQETISAGVPILGIPVFGDQYLNIAQTAAAGHGELLQYKHINEDNLRSLLNKMLKDDRYTKTAKEVAARFKDRPMPPLETAVWWTEYVLRHKGADFVKSPTLQMSFLAYNMLDVYLFLLSVVLSVVYVIYKLVKVVTTKKSKKDKTKKAKKS